MKVDKPWGYYEDIYRSQQVTYKKLTIFPGEEISLQYHLKRSEFWYITEGSGIFVYNGLSLPVDSTYTVFIPRMIEHQIINNGSTNIIIFETQVGECDENDVIRKRDKYAR